MVAPPANPRFFVGAACSRHIKHAKKNLTAKTPSGCHTGNPCHGSNPTNLTRYLFLAAMTDISRRFKTLTRRRSTPKTRKRPRVNGVLLNELNSPSEQFLVKTNRSRERLPRPHTRLSHVTLGSRPSETERPLGSFTPPPARQFASPASTRSARDLPSPPSETMTDRKHTRC